MLAEAAQRIDHAAIIQATLQAASSVILPCTPSATRRKTRIRSIAKAVIYIEATFAQRLSLGAIAEAACMSRFHFARAFRDEIGMSPMQYVRWRRVVEAERRLVSGEASLLRLAEELGYFDHSHFSRSFKAATGMRPNQYVGASIGGGATA